MIRALLLIAMVFPATAWAQDEGDPPAGQAVYVGNELLKDYRPASSLVTKVTDVTKPRFPVVDVHCHWFIQQDPQFLLTQMDKLGVRRAVNLSGGYGRQLEAMLKKFRGVAPDRLLVLANVDFSKIDEPTFPLDAVAALRRARADGVSGLKIFKSLGLTIRDRTGSVVPIDDPRLDPIWAVCGELKMPVLIHAADPLPFFQPVDNRNERWMQLKRHPDWSFYGPQFPSYDAVLRQLLNVVRRHRETTFIAAHLANSGNDLPKLAAWFDENPNLVADLSGRVPELGRQPYAARKFLIKYADRVLFGTDRYPGRPDQPRYAIYYRFLETDDEYFDYYDNPFPTEGEWKIYGVFLPDDVLREVYAGNAERVLGIAR